MKAKLVLLLSSALLLGACDNGTQETTGAATTAGAQASSDCPAPFYQVLPDPALRFDFRFHIATDRMYQTNKGEARRRIVMEYLEGNATQAWNRVESAMVAAGYVLRSERVVVAGKGTFTKAGSPSLFVDTTGASVKDPAHPQARGTIWISWPDSSAKFPAKKKPAPARPTAAGAPATSPAAQA